MAITYHNWVNMEPDYYLSLDDFKSNFTSNSTQCPVTSYELRETFDPSKTSYTEQQHVWQSFITLNN